MQFLLQELDISKVVHGDDFLIEGPADRLMKMNLALEKSFQAKTEVIAPDPGQQREARILNRVVRWEDTGITWEPDPRHAEIMIEQMGLNDSSSIRTISSTGMSPSKTPRSSTGT